MRETSAEQPFGHHRAAVGDGQQKEKFRDESRFGHCMIRLDPEHNAIRSRDVARRYKIYYLRLRLFFSPMKEMIKQTSTPPFSGSEHLRVWRRGELVLAFRLPDGASRGSRPPVFRSDASSCAAGSREYRALHRRPSPTDRPAPRVQRPGVQNHPEISGLVRLHRTLPVLAQMPVTGTHSKEAKSVL